jgi:hypothetical protein
VGTAGGAAGSGRGKRKVVRDAAGSRRSSPFAQAERAVGCRKLGEVGLVDLDLCCERCHAADRFALDGLGALGPCREVLADGTAVLVCCAARKQLI